MSNPQSRSTLRVALIGYGRMGREIAGLAPDHDVSIAARFDADTPLGTEPGADFDVAVEFTRPDAAPANIRRVLEWNRPVVVGTTGWLGELESIRADVARHGGRLLYGSNFSIGVNIFLSLIRTAGTLFNEYAMYDAAVHEIHHTRKADSPSGTAISIADVLLATLARKSRMLAEPAHGPIDPHDLHVSSQRIGTTVGTHTVTFDSEADTVELTHRAKNRTGFALGALLAARWLVAQPAGLYRFEDIFEQPAQSTR
ncbi:MAG: 4-hydroxy-tetrahydrodipicolinate reductase [Bacteroidetes bacterium]|nr:4-hydroxy-tetrahydrodipicolinate reductase [Bacteroidota bacterium]